MNIKVLDTTLRDGEQTPGVSLSNVEKFRIASKLDDIGVEFIEAGSAVISEGERKSIKEISSQGLNAEILSFSRPLEKDINFCLDCDVDAINLVIPTSDIHINDKLKIDKSSLLNLSNTAIEYSKDHGLKIELSAEDASRSSIDFVNKVFSDAVEYGADRLCICDTVGIFTPKTSFQMFSSLNSFNIPLSCHCHNDFGLAVANTITALNAGATEFHSTVNGIGERAGNTSFEEMVVIIDRLLSNFNTNVKINELYDLSKLVTRLTGVYIQPNKAIVGANAFTHESGIHSDGVIKNSETYEPMTPELVGRKRKFVVGKHMGMHGLDKRLKELDLNVNKDQLEQIFHNIKDLADKGKTVTDVDVQAIADNILEINHKNKVNLEDFSIVSGNKVMPTASIKLNFKGKEILNAGIGLGPVDAVFNAIKKSVSDFSNIELVEYHVDAITGGADAFVDVIVKLKKGDKIISARGTEPDIIDASVKAYISGVNRLID